MIILHVFICKDIIFGRQLFQWFILVLFSGKLMMVEIQVSLFFIY